MPPTDDTLLVTAAASLRQAALDWGEYLARERRLAAKTLEAYSRDVGQRSAKLGAVPRLRTFRPQSFQESDDHRRPTRQLAQGLVVAAVHRHRAGHVFAG